MDLAKYNYIKVPAYDVWGILMKKKDPLAKKKALTLNDLINKPLICPRPWLELYLSQWFGEKSDKINVVATVNLAFNASIMVKTGMGYALTFDKIIDTSESSEPTFRPIKGILKSEMFIIWRKHQTFSHVAKLLLDELSKRFNTQKLAD